ncbi:MAG TPA: hypothetical protein VLZ74_14755 [Methylocella sp.]|nr:hypothetical protein [Methylocella sp.]
MNITRIKAVIEALLYEGYMLYPYRPSSIKNRQRWTFGGLFPRAFGAGSGDACEMQTQALFYAAKGAEVGIHIRFLHPLLREIGRLAAPSASLPTNDEVAYDIVPLMEVDGVRYLPCEEAIEREIVIPDLSVQDLCLSPRPIVFEFEGERGLDPIRDQAGTIVGVSVRTALTIQGSVEIAAEQVAHDVFRLTVRIANETPLTAEELASRNVAQPRAFASTHMILNIRNGEFISLLDPPQELREEAATCENRGTWPVLIGEEGEKDALLSSPIILYDYPAIAPESPGDLFDGTEIDEILTLRILAMTDDEKREMAAADARARALLLRTEALTPAELTRLHATMRAPASPVRDSATPEEGSQPALPRGGPPRLAVGVHVRLRPKACGDIMDLALKDKVAVVEAIERDFEDRVHVAVTLIDDPGRDLGAAGFPGHRFYFSQEEIEPLGLEVPQ